ncbi:MAG: lysophospholipase [Candidatus Limnocylindrales bacterium]
MREEEATFAGADGVRLFRRAWLPDGTVLASVAVVHGFGDHAGRYLPLVEALVPAGFAVQALDLRGHGRSPGRRGHIDAWRQYRDDVVALLEVVHASNAVEPLFLYGHSLGGVIALELGLRRGEELRARLGLGGVVASAPALAPIGARRPVLEALSRPLARVWPGFSLDLHIDRSALSRRAAEAAVDADDPLTHGRISARTARETLAALAWTRANAPAWRLPLLIIHGSADRLADPDASRGFAAAARAGGAPDVTLRIYAGGFHEPHHDLEADEALTDVRIWLEAHLAGTGATNAAPARLLGEGGV